MRWWDGVQWGTATHRPEAPAGWTGGGIPYPSESQQAALTPSGMRPVADFFSDIGLVIRHGWKQIIGISLVIWVVAGAIMGALSSFTVDFGELRTLADDFEAALNQYGDTGSGFPDSVTQQLLDQLGRAFPLSVLGYVAIGVGLTVVLMLASALQTAAVNRVAIDAASGEPVSWGAGWRASWSGGLRLLVVWLLLGLLFSVLWGGWIGLIALAVMVSGWLAALVGVVGFVIVFAVTIYLAARLVPMPAQAAMGGHIIGWSWSRTRGRTLAVFGRWLLWALIASLALQAVSAVIAFPLGLIPSATNASDLIDYAAGSFVVALFTMPLYSALSGLMTIGAVPIWRDLTDLEPYRSIDENGQPKQVAA